MNGPVLVAEYRGYSYERKRFVDRTNGKAEEYDKHIIRLEFSDGGQINVSLYVGDPGPWKGEASFSKGDIVTVVLMKWGEDKGVWRGAAHESGIELASDSQRELLYV